MNNKIESAFYKTIMEGVAKYVKKNTPTYTIAKIVNIDDDGTPYVRFPGAETTTPVTTVTNAAKGDDVLVQVNSNGDAYVYGNLTDQPVSKVEIEKNIQNTTNLLQKFEYSLTEIKDSLTDTFVSIGESNIPTLSDVMNRSDSGPNIYGNIDTIGDNYIQVNDKGIDIKKITTAGKIDEDHDTKELHIGSDYITFTNQLATWIGTMGANSVAIGSPIMAVGNYAFAFGRFTYALANQSVAMGYNCRAEGTESFALGYGCHTKGSHSFATGYACKTGYNISNPEYAANCAFAEGSGSVANGQRSHAENCSTATGIDSHAQGYATQANGWASHSGGIQTIAGYEAQTVIGKRNLNQSDTYFEVGNGSGNTNSNAFDVTTDGYIRTGVGSPTKVAFGSVNNYYGWYDSNGSFSPWAFLVNGKVPETLLPSYVDDVIEGYYYNGSFYEDDQYQTLITPERGKIYISLDTDKSYRWSGTVFVEMTSGGVVYTAGTGIDISVTNVISVDNTIARVSDMPVVPTNVSAFTNDAGYLTQHQDLSNYIQKSLTAGLVKNDGTIDTTTYATASDIPDVSNFISKSQTSGLVKNDGTIDTNNYALVSAIPTALSALTDDAAHRLVTDTEKSTWNGKSDFSGSYNDLTDKPTIPAAQVNSDWNATSGLAKILNKPTLATVATSGSYNDLSNKPTIPAAQVNSDWNATSGVARILNKPTFATVATSGSYNDLSNKPTIPDISTKVSKSGDTMTGDLSFGNGIGIKGYNWSNGYGVNIHCGVELWPNSTTANYGGYIDFHYNKDSSDNTSRIIENASGRLSINGALFSSNGKIEGNQISANNTGSGAATNAAFKASTSTSGQVDYYIGNSVAQGTLEVTSAGILGLWSYQKGDWVYYTDPSGNATFKGNALTATGSQGNFVINSQGGNYSEGLRINSTPNDAHGFALITIGTQSGTATGVSDSYPTYQIGKWNDGNFYMGFRSVTTGNNENFLIYEPTLNGGGSTGTLRIGARNYISGSGETRVLCGTGVITEASSGGKALLLLFAQARASTAYNVRLYRIYNGNVSYISLGSSGSSLGTVSISGNNVIFTSSVAGVDIYPIFIGAN